MTSEPREVPLEVTSRVQVVPQADRPHLPHFLVADQPDRTSVPTLRRAPAEPLISVILPTYNRAYCLLRAVHSVLQQTHDAVELIIVDDGSTDETHDLISARRSRRCVQYIRQENQGVAAARNRGLREAQGEYIAFLDSDDFWKPWKLELQLACLRALPEAGMIWSDMEAFNAEGRLISANYLAVMYHAYRRYTFDELFHQAYALKTVAPQLEPLVKNGKLYVGEIYSPMILGNLVHTSTVLLRRERLEKVGEFDTTLQVSGEDFDFYLRTCREGPVAFTDLATMVYQTGLPDRLTHPSKFIYIAQNYLKTVTIRLAQDRDRISLPQGLIDAKLADVNAWLGDLLMMNGDHRQARKHLAASLRLNIWQPRTAGLLFLTYLPEGFGKLARHIYRWLKSFIQADGTVSETYHQ
jgi:glycosyltransferase involved in cell wall biosynthesis